jgi:hypothetical protein
MKISVRDYRGIARANIELNPIALVAGRNEAGKSSLLQAVQALLVTHPLVSGVAKKDAKVLVREGAEEAEASLRDEEAIRVIQWPKCETEVTADDALKCSWVAAGLVHPFALNGVNRAELLAKYIDAEPTAEDVKTAAADIGYNEAAAAKLHDSISSAGWDITHQRARDYGIQRKGEWEGVTGEAYGSKKAATWKPEKLPEEADRDTLANQVGAAKQALIKAQSTAAVSAAEIARLTKAVELGRSADVEALEAQLATTKAELEAAEKERMGMPAEVGGKSKNEQLPCPSCGTLLVVAPTYNGPTQLLEFKANAARDAVTKKTQNRVAELDGMLARLRPQVGRLQEQVYAARRTRDDGFKAAGEIAAIGSNEGTAPDAIAAAMTAQDAAEAALAAFDAHTRARSLHALIAMNEKLVALLAPDGLRRRKLASGLADFNQALTAVSDHAGWAPVRFDEALNPHYGTRPLAVASKSGQWRARTIVQIAMALLDGSVAVVIDDADILIDGQSRTGLLRALQAAGLKALVVMAYSKRESVPPLDKLGMGASYWVESGVAEAL